MLVFHCFTWDFVYVEGLCEIKEFDYEGFLGWVKANTSWVFEAPSPQLAMPASSSQWAGLAHSLALLAGV